MTFLGEVIELYLQWGIFLEIFFFLNKETKVQDWRILQFLFFSKKCI